MMRAYFEMMMHELEHRWHCKRLHGSDQAIHNYLVYTGKLVRSGEHYVLDCTLTYRDPGNVPKSVPIIVLSALLKAPELVPNAKRSLRKSRH